MVFQVGSSLLDACVLAALKDNDAYGYMLTQKLKEALDISESTLYPVLRRLQKEQYLATYDEPYDGRNRRYYKITDSGLKQLNFYNKEWIIFRTQINTLFNGGIFND